MKHQCNGSKVLMAVQHALMVIALCYGSEEAACCDTQAQYSTVNDEG